MPPARASPCRTTTRTSASSSRAPPSTAPAPPPTTVTVKHARTIITRNQSPDVHFDRSINANRGREQSRNGCVGVARDGRSAHYLLAIRTSL